MRAVLAVLLATLLLLAGAEVRAAPDLTGKRILVLVPYAYGRVGLDQFVRAYVEALRRGGMRPEHIVVEHLGLDRDPSPEHRRRVRELILARHVGQPFDFIAPLQQLGLDFALEELTQIAPAAPILAVDSVSPAPATLGRHAVLLALPEPSVRATLEQALRLFPATERLIVAVGAAPTDQKAKHLIASVISQMGLRLAVEYTDAMSTRAMLERVAAAPPHSIILTGPLTRDATGAPMSTFDTAIALARRAAAPVFVTFSSGIGEGTIGGSVQHVERLSAASAAAVLDVLSARRTLPPGISLLRIAPTNMYDWTELKRWGADPGRLPADTIYINRPPSVWEEHRDLVLAAAATIVLLSILSASLMVQQHHLRMAERRFRVLVEHAPEAIVVYDPERGRFVDCNSKAERLFGATHAELMESGPERFYADQQPDGLPVLASMSRNAARGLTGEELMFERSVRTLDGRIFPCEVCVVALPSSSGRLLRGSYVDISERKKAERELAQRSELLEQQVAERTAALSLAAHKAEAANRAKSVFLANMSHELRTPLNSVIGFSQIMMDSTSMFDEEKHNLGLINRAGHHLLTLINDILELSKIEAGQVRLAVTIEDIAVLMREAADMVRLAAQQKGIALHVSCPAASLPVRLDGVKLRQVLINLLSNAVKFTDSGNVILALTLGEASESSLQLAFSVQDSGIGIDGAELDRIFEPFIQVDTPRSTAGTGLGLTISRQFVLLLGGELKVRSRMGEGSEFSFSIPVQADPDCAAIVAPCAPELPAAAQAALDPDTFSAIPAAQRAALCTALQQLDMRQAASLLAVLRAEHCVSVAVIETMLARHRHPELCALLAASLGSRRAA